MGLKVYVAARYGRRIEMQNVHAKLRAAGLEPTSKWVDGNEEGMTQAEAAQMDVEDVRRAAVILYFAEQVGFVYSGGGRNFELGMAYERGMVTVVVGEREHVFLNLPDMRVCEDVDSAVAYVKKISEVAVRAINLLSSTTS